MASVISCDTCGGALDTVPGLGLLCANGCSFDRLGKTTNASAPAPEKAEPAPTAKSAPRRDDGLDWRGKPFGEPAETAPAAAKRPHQRLRERWDVPERPAATPPPARPETPDRPAPASAWEVFDARLTRRGGVVCCRIGKNGQLLIGAALSAQLGNPERVELRYDRAGQRIGLAPTSGLHGAKVTRGSKGQQLRVSLMGMLAHFGLKCPEKNVVIHDAKIESGVLVLPVRGWGS
jgi:hypothetical protein